MPFDVSGQRECRLGICRNPFATTHHIHYLLVRRSTQLLLSFSLGWFRMRLAHYCARRATH